MAESYKYYIGCGDGFGKNDRPNEIFNKDLVPFLEKLNIGENGIKTIASMVEEIAQEAYSNGYINSTLSET